MRSGVVLWVFRVAKVAGSNAQDLKINNDQWQRRAGNELAYHEACSIGDHINQSDNNNVFAANTIFQAAQTSVSCGL